MIYTVTATVTLTIDSEDATWIGSADEARIEMLDYLISGPSLNDYEIDVEVSA